MHCCYYLEMKKGLGVGAWRYQPGLISFLVMFLHCHLPLLRSREALRDGTQRRKNSNRLGTFQMKGQGPALRATKKSNPLLAFASQLTSGPHRQEQNALGSPSMRLRAASREARLEEPPAAKEGAFLCPGAASTAHLHGIISYFISTHPRQLWQSSGYQNR